MSEFQGTRVHSYDEFFDTGPGAYWKVIVKGEPEPLWMNFPPCGHQGRLATQTQDNARHTVTEHDDGTITVSPSIFCHNGGEDGRQPCWHGFLEHGVWRSV